MNRSGKFIYVVLILLFFNGTISYSQNQEQKDSLDINLKNIAREIMTKAGTCGLITLDKNELPMVRVMDPFAPESDFTVWFGTNPKSRKVEQIKQNPNVTLYYVDSDVSGYVVIHGKAQLIDDPKEKKKRWKTEWEDFYPDKPSGYLLIKVSPDWMEVLSYTHGINGDPVTWQPQRVNFSLN
jgi:general stress protein 26